MTLRHMRIFIEVFRHMNMSRAAESLHLSQPAVSLAISELEKYYGIALFDRIGRRLYVTEAGKRFYSYALHIIATFDAMETGIRNWDFLGQLRIGASISLGTRLLPRIIQSFSAEFHPQAGSGEISPSDAASASQREEPHSQIPEGHKHQAGALLRLQIHPELHLAADRPLGKQLLLEHAAGELVNVDPHLNRRLRILRLIAHHTVKESGSARRSL